MRSNNTGEREFRDLAAERQDHNDYMRSYRAARRKPKVPRAAPAKTASPVLRDIFAAAEAAGMTLEALGDGVGTRSHVIWRYRSGVQAPDIMRAEALAEAAGGRLVFVTP